MNWLWYVLGALLILLLLAWILGLFAADEDAAAVSTDPAATEETTIEEPVTDGAAATEGGATGGATAGDAATDAAD